VVVVIFFVVDNELSLIEAYVVVVGVVVSMVYVSVEVEKVVERLVVVVVVVLFNDVFIVVEFVNVPACAATCGNGTKEINVDRTVMATKKTTKKRCH
jgi:hypothetical protein